jgi:hypothetical protein
VYIDSYGPVPNLALLSDGRKKIHFGFEIMIRCEFDLISNSAAEAASCDHGWHGWVHLVSIGSLAFVGSLEVAWKDISIMTGIPTLLSHLLNIDGLDVGSNQRRLSPQPETSSHIIKGKLLSLNQGRLQRFAGQCLPAVSTSDSQVSDVSVCLQSKTQQSYNEGLNDWRICF